MLIRTDSGGDTHEFLAWLASPGHAVHGHRVLSELGGRGQRRPARAWEPKRLRLFSAAGSLARGGRRLRLRITATWPWATQITTAITRLQALAPG